ncbi:FRIGIDA-like protein [Actinidia chinensis var. chinensis]|uniref:FRIGIDA-like protein n=1 Tax=Actinidia chinensis var. chinensis TaxID=1590841 RepID=A0A2R6QD35_ACTCC|nr:FRIGIDA-like protein [Actinidia chinensis var. chinensis]
MATIKTISAALKLVDAKKENLRKAFDDLQSHSSCLSSFSLSWPDLDFHFSSLQSSLQHKFKILQSQQEQLQSQPSDPPPQPEPQPSDQPPESAEARPELRSFCENMDGLGLRKYMIDRPDSRFVIKAELPDALRHAPDAPTMVVDAMAGFYAPDSKKNKKGDKDVELCAIRRNCVVLLESLMRLGVEIGGEVREKAKKIAMDWKRNMSVNGDNPLEVLGFLHLLATYGLADCFSVEDLVDFTVVIARFHQSVELCRVLAFGDRISDLILKLISKGKQLLAVKFIFEFELTDKFPPVPLLKAYVKESKKLGKKDCKGGKSSLGLQKEAITKEVNALKSVIKVIEEHKLESEYPNEKLVKRIETLEKLKLDRKQSEASHSSKTQQQSKLQKFIGNKRPRKTAPAGPAATPGVAATSSTAPAFQQSHLQPAGLLPEHPAPYLSSPAGPYGLAGSAVTPYAGSSAGFYGSAGASLGVPGNAMPTQPYVYPSESHIPSGYYDRPIAYAGYGLPPQYHPPYYPK